MCHLIRFECSSDLSLCCSFQDLLASRKQKLKITEEILVEKGDQKKHLDKDVEKMKRRESYVEKELIDRKIFEKEPTKKK